MLRLEMMFAMLDDLSDQEIEQLETRIKIVKQLKAEDKEEFEKILRERNYEKPR